MTSLNEEKFVEKLKENSKPSEIRKHLIGNPILSDVYFQFEEEDNDENEASPLYAHKLLLASAIPFFYKYFKQVHSNNVCVRIKGMRRSILKEIINYAYTDTINMNELNMFDILRAAKMMEIGFLTSKATDLISKKIDHMNVYKVLNIAQSNKNEPLKQRCLQYIKSEPDYCIHSSDNFPKISYEMLKYILQSCKLNISDGKLAVIRWVEYKPSNEVNAVTETRVKFLSELMECVLTKCEDHINPVTESLKRMVMTPNFTNIISNESTSRVLNTNSSSTSESTLMTFDLIGTFDRRNMKFIILSIIAKRKVHLKEIHFMYDLSSTDTEVEIKIINPVDDLHNNIYYDRVNIQDRLINGVFTKYVLSRSCILFGDRKYQIKIQFPNYEFRPLWKNVKYPGEKSHLDLDSDLNANVFANSQIIKSLVFKI